MSDSFFSVVPLTDFHKACAERDEARTVARMLLGELRDGTIAWDGTEWLMRSDMVDKWPWLEVGYD